MKSICALTPSRLYGALKIVPQSVQRKAQFPGGSIWRKWDVQVHTPYSALNNGFGDDFTAYAKRLIEKVCDENVAVACVGITDYFTIKGYAELRALLADRNALHDLVGAQLAEKVGTILFIPNVELRTKIIIRDPKGQGKDSRVNFHVLFSDEVTPDDIYEHFLHELKFTAAGNPNSRDECWKLSERNLSALGNRLRSEHEPFAGKSDLFVGMMNAVIDDGDISEILESKPSIFKDRYLLCFPCDEDLSKCSWDGQGHQTRKVLVQKSHLLLSSNARTREFGLGQMHQSANAFVNEFKTLKPCIHSSDSHTYDEICEPKQGRYTWIKADPTFHGLRQLLNEPGDRVAIGRNHPHQTESSQRATRIIKSIEIRKLPTATTQERWFDCELELNSELVAIIGNKGSGKSALSDILALLGNTRRDAFSFLCDAKFRNVKGSRARQFYATLTWLDATRDKVNSLDDKTRLDAVEKIKYIPQNYLEVICTDLESGKDSQFYKELEGVIFSHVKHAERLGHETLAELLTHRTEETVEAITEFVGEIHELNVNIVGLEDLSSPHNRNTLAAQLAEKNRELDAHRQARPPVMAKPEEDPAVKEQSMKFEQVLETKRVELESLEEELKVLRTNDGLAAKREILAEKLAGKVRNLQHHVDTFVSDHRGEFEALDLDISQIVTFAVNAGSLKEVLVSIQEDRQVIERKLDPAQVDSVETKRVNAVTAIKSVQGKLGEAQSIYQAHLESIRAWQNVEAGIIGTPDVVGSISYLQTQIRDLDGVPKRIRQVRKERDRKLLAIFRQKQKLQSYYERYYGDVQEFLETHPLAEVGRFMLKFNVSMAESGFAARFFEHVDRRKTGPFMREDEGTLEMKRLLEGADFSNEVGVFRFVKRLFRMMSNRGQDPLAIRNQLRGNHTVQALYDYVYSLEFLSPIYNLQWDGKRLEQLSPGERGSLLLIFYLLVDQDDIPLVIDQPEENLDNQTVFKILVPCIKHAKKRRQIIMVTHNPNLAVVCDAEQIICAEMQKNQAHRVHYITGSIEEPEINRRIVDILEGTRPAFDKRDDKYIPLVT